MKVLVTGASGRVGRYVCTALLKDGVEVRATDRSYRPGVPVKPVIENLLSREGCYRLVDGMDVVVHLANHPSILFGDPQRVFSENCAININVFQAAVEMGIRKIIFASSIQAFTASQGPADGRKTVFPYLPLDSNMPAAPVNAYGMSKIAAEQLLECLVRTTSGLCAVAVRFPLIIMPDMVAGGWSAGRWRRNLWPEGFAFLCVEDAAALTAAAVQANLTGYRCYFAAAGNNSAGVPVADLVKRFYADVPLKKPIEQLDSLVDTAVIQSDLGWRPTVSEQVKFEPIDLI